MARGAIQAEACPACGLRYDRFHPRALSYTDAYVETFRESQRRVELGDYSYPASRRHVLGRMRAAKVAVWDVHVEECVRAKEEFGGGVCPATTQEGSS